MAKVLVAEDELLIAMDIIDELSAAGFGTMGPFATRTQALDYCRTHTPDCAVLDVRLQDGDCFPLADYLAEHHVPIVFHSGHANRGALTERYNNAEVLPKPSPTSQIATAVEKLCKSEITQSVDANSPHEAARA